MGGTVSKEVITIEEARERISDDDLKRLIYAYRKLYNNNNNRSSSNVHSNYNVGISFSNFDRYILCEYLPMPRKLKLIFFYSLLGRSKDVFLTFDDLLRAYAVTYLGTMEEKCTLIFYMLTVTDGHRSGYGDSVMWEKKLHKESVVDFAKFFASFPKDILLQRSMFIQLFESDTEVTEEEFVDWAVQAEVSKTIFIRWISIVGKGIFNKIAKYDLSEINKQEFVMIENDNSGKISRRNSFNTNRKKDKSDAAAQQAYILNWLKDKYLELEALKENEDVDDTGLNINNINIKDTTANNDKTAVSKDVNSVDEIQLGDLFSPPIPRRLLNLIFYYADEKNVGMVDSGFFVGTLSRMFTGSSEEKFHFIFDLFDRDEDGFLSKSELINIFRSLNQIEEELEQDGKVTRRLPMKSTVSKFRVAMQKAAAKVSTSSRKNRSDTTNKHINTLVNHLLQNDSCKMTYKEWENWASTNPNIFSFIETTIQKAIESTPNTRLSPSAELEAIIEAKNPMYSDDKIREGEEWFILSRPWWRKWEAYARSEQKKSKQSLNSYIENSSNNDISNGLNNFVSIDRPGKIDQSNILSGVTKISLCSTIYYNQDYVIVNKKVWKLLVSWYGGGPEIKRTVVKDGDRVELELHPVTLRISMKSVEGEKGGEIDRPRRMRNVIDIVVSRFQTATQVKRIACSAFGLRYFNKVRMWDCRQDRHPMLIRPVGGVESRTVEDFDFLDGQSIQLEEMSRNGEWPFKVDLKNHAYQPALSKLPGIAGLYNLGNTCYINASVQGLMHVPLLSEYFCKEYHISDLNATAALGSKNAELACAYSLLTNEMMGKKASSYAVSPRIFKRSLGHFNRMFTGYNQHDAQEFLSLFMDGLHEDINRVRKKMYVEIKDSDGRPDDVVANEWWDNHLRRDNSIVQTLFAGQFKSKVQCAACGYISNRFEPFTMLQVPLPLPSEVTIEIVIVFCGSNKQSLRLGLRLKKGNSSPFHIKKAIESMDSDIPNYLKPNGQPLKSKDMVIGYCRSVRQIDKILRDDESIRLGSTKVISNRNPYICYHSPVNDKKRYLSTVGFKTGLYIDIAFKKNIVKLGRIEKIYDEDDQILDVEFDNDDEIKQIYGDDKQNAQKGDEVNDNNDNSDSYDEDEGEELYISKTINVNMVIPDPTVLYFINRVQYNRKYYFGVEKAINMVDRPFLLRLITTSTTCKELYKIIYEHSQQIIPANLRKDKIDLDIDYTKISGTDDDLETNYDAAATVKNDTGIMNQLQEKYGFSLHFVDMDYNTYRRNHYPGLSCPNCPWTDRCQGCLITDVENIYLNKTFRKKSITIAIQWNENNSNTYIRKSTSKIEGAKFRQPIKHESINRCDALDNKRLSIYECINKYCKEEKMDGKDQVYCSKCKEHQDHTKQVTLYRPPPVLIIHLKRFKFTQRHGEKISTQVNFPINGLDLSFAYSDKPKDPIPLDLTWWEYLGGKYDANRSVERTNDDDEEEVETKQENMKDEEKMVIEKDNFVYDCVGVVNHFGGTSGGHYVAYAKNSYDNKWRQFDDSRVRVISRSEVVSRNAYIMFYVRRDLPETGVEEIYKCRKPTKKQAEEFNKLVASTTRFTSMLDKCILA